MLKQLNMLMVKLLNLVVKAVNCCRLLCAPVLLRAVESVVEAVDCCRLHYVL